MNNKTSLEFICDLLSRFGANLYIVNPGAQLFTRIEDVPNYKHRAWPMLPIMLLIEVISRWLQKRNRIPYNDVVMHSGALLLTQFLRYSQYGAMVIMMDYLYENCRLITLPPDNVYVWIFGFILMDFQLYWGHRILHTVNLFWAFHQYHHSSKRFHMATAWRLSMFDLNVALYYNALLAIIIPPPIIAIHMQLAFLYMVWIHTESITKLGVLEYILNTPSNHRVHHGRNERYRDKNFGSVLIIFDHLFGTYEPEDERVMYGITTNVDRYGHDTVYQQFHYIAKVGKKVVHMKGVSNKMSAIFKSPGWSPDGSSVNRDKVNSIILPEYEPQYLLLPLWKVIYTCINATLMVIGFYMFGYHPKVFHSPQKLLIGLSYVILSYTSIASIYDKRKIASLLESIRCVLYFLFEYLVIPVNIDSLAVIHLIMGNQSPDIVNGVTEYDIGFTAIRIMYLISSMVWLCDYFRECFCTDDDRQKMGFIQKSEFITLAENIILIVILIICVIFYIIICWNQFFEIN